MGACTYYSYQEDAVKFYQAKGRIDETGTLLINWKRSGGYQNEPSIEYPLARAEQVLDEVEVIVKNTNDNLVLAHPEVAVILFLMGIIKPAQLALAKESNYCIEIQNVVLGGKTITIRVLQKFVYFLSSSDGRIVF